MATVHKLLPPPRPDRRTGQRGTADIIIFPGVRYERMVDAPAKSKRRRRTRVKRDHLVISA